MIRSADDGHSVLKAISPLLAAFGGMGGGDVATDVFLFIGEGRGEGSLI
jgi:hypothetical protein